MLADRVAALLEVSAPERDLDWVRTSLDAAIALELSTIPPYLCAYWSIEDPADPVAGTIRTVVMEEMAHMGLVSNLQKAVGGRPVIRGAAPAYPTRLPGHVREQLTVHLAGLTPRYLKEVMMEIEMPEHPVVTLAAEAETFPTIGAFYDALAAALSEVNPAFDASVQLERSDLKVVVIGDLTMALKVIERIKGQGEGTTTTATFEGELAHFYEFAEIYHGRKLIEVNGSPRFEGDPVQFPRVLPMGAVPAGGWPNRDPDGTGTLQAFNESYGIVLDGLQKAWDNVDATELSTAIGEMRGLTPLAQALMQIPLGTGGEHYGPDFVL